MKRTTFALLMAVLVATTFTGCPSAPGAVGTWYLAFDVGCDGQVAGEGQVTLFAGGDGIAAGVSSVNWSYGSTTSVINIGFIFPGNIQAFTGQLSGNSMAGTYSYSAADETGCWEAVRQ